MNKSAPDPKVKKTLLRNYELKVRPSMRKPLVVHDTASSSNLTAQTRSSQKENELCQPSLCSSGAIANYLSDVKKQPAKPVSSDDLNVDKGQLCAKMTKKLNFHFNDRIYRNLIELNASVENSKGRKERRASSITSQKRDLEPNIEDFYEDEIEVDSPPTIPVLKPKFKPIKKVEDNRLHKLVAAFEDL
ncbi:unnamed protein product [Chrysodeixis includens]|uniref:Protein phosphatase 1 regulatory subunit 35 C-terminal domain-containing protein n=1 Tax=Chrysodeixis includens TaxID=689277 RepID=A0A9P0FU71_CHRIL|nr:unnamed protein product [Chrysodeixis includens]